MRKIYDRHDVPAQDTDPDAQSPHRSKKRKTVASHPYGLEMKSLPGSGMNGFSEWTRYWRWYATPEQRDAALASLSRKGTLYEYRPIQRGTKT